MTTTSSTTSSSSSSVLDTLMRTNSASTTSGAASADQFLTLLVTQMQNQDPMNPMDNAQMTSQLAQINTVKGIAQLNETMTKLMTAYGDSMSMQASALIGKNILTEGKNMVLGSSGAAAGMELAANADTVTVTIKNSAGKTVSTEELGSMSAGTQLFTWDGKDASGNSLPTGNYTFSIEAKKAGKAVTATALEAGTVSALTKTSSGFQLEVAGLGNIDFANVKKVF